MSGGRPTAYRDEYADQAYKLCLLGATDAELAGFFGVSEQTVNAWKKKHSAFLESLKAGKESADARVAQRLLDRALGVTVKETRMVGGGDDDEPSSAIEVTKELPPDTTAAIFWLKNRNPAKWRDKQDHEHSGAVEITKIERTVVDPKHSDG